MDKSNRIVFITSIDDGNHQAILSHLTSGSNATIILNLNVNGSELKKTSPPSQRKTGTKRRQADLTCVICQGRAYGYNFNQITCESCKAFFRRNALHPIEKTKCLNLRSSLNDQRCEIRFDLQWKCQRCRLLKCLESGMRKDLVLTPEEKRLKQERLEENRRRCVGPIYGGKSSSISNDRTKMEPIIEERLCLTASDWDCLKYLHQAYQNACQSSPSASSIVSFDLTPDKMSAYMNTLDIQNFAAMRLINFLREIPEFDQLDETDRVTLVKFNLTLLFVIRYALTFDPQRELIYDGEISESVLKTEEAFAQQCKSLFILCYGYEFNRSFMSILHSVVNLVSNDSTLVQLLMLTMIFLKGLSGNNDQEPSLNDNHQVFLVHSKYTDLLFRYLISKYSFRDAVKKMIRIVEIFIKSQRIIRDFQQYIKTKIDVEHVNPLMKSLLNLN